MIEKEKNIIIQKDTIKTAIYNNTKTMMLHVEKVSSSKRPMPTINYSVYKVDTQKLLKKDSFQGVDVQWNDSTSLKLIPYIGMERKPMTENPNEVSVNNTNGNAIIVKVNDSL